MKCAIILIIVAGLAVCTLGREIIWGKPGSNDYLLAKDKVKKLAILGLVVTKKYVFKQKGLDAVTITGVKVTDRMKKNGGTVELLHGGPGSKGATLYFKSQRGHGIKALVEIWGQRN